MSELSEFFADTVVPQLLDGLGDDVAHWPRGDSSREETIRAIVDRTNVTPEGAQIEGMTGSKIVGYLTLSILKTVTITINEKGTDLSVVIVDGERWYAQKLLSEDEGAGGFRHYQFTRSIPIATARAAGR